MFTLCQYIYDNGIGCERCASWLLFRGRGLWKTTPLCDAHVGLVRGTLGSGTSWAERLPLLSEAEGG